MMAAAVLLVGILVVNVRACLFYASAYAKATRRGFLAVVRDPHARAVYRLSRRLAARRSGQDVRMLFDVALPREDATAAYADAVLVGERGLGVFCVLEGRGSVYGDVDDGSWVLVSPGRAGGSERLIPNVGARAASAAAAAEAYLLLDGEGSAPVVPMAVFGRLVEADHAAVPEDVAVATPAEAAARLAEALRPPEDGEAPPLDEAARRRVFRALRACANACGFDGPAQDASKADDGARASATRDSGAAPDRSLRTASARREPASLLRGIVQRERGESATAELVRKADRLAASKEDFDALTWDRVLEISVELEDGQSAERLAELAAELRLIARTNVSLNYRFGIAPAPDGARLSPAGLVMRSSVGALSRTEPDAQMSAALQDTAFFDAASEGTAAIPTPGEKPVSSIPAEMPYETDGPHDEADEMKGARP